GRWVSGCAAYWSGGWALRPRVLPAPVVAVLAVLLVLTVVTHLPLLLLGSGRGSSSTPATARRARSGRVGPRPGEHRPVVSRRRRRGRA
ncbi:hypothetical protein, partial [Nocardioides kribbensis]|uniref:hypothetical protein n=1 Tax=Nocardioides kribbensis TaxID=305517 RepID=UPI0032DA009D